MGSFSVPYGHGRLSFEIPGRFSTQVVEPTHIPGAKDPVALVSAALDEPYGGKNLGDFQGAGSVAIAISDNTRPVPHQHLLPPLLQRLLELGCSPADIHFFIATGLHTNMGEDEYSSILPDEIINTYPISCHDADNQKQQVYLGETTRGTPVWINRRFVESDLRMVVGNIEPHQIQGFSGGVKGVAIGLAGRETIHANHSMLLDPHACMGSFDKNPARQDSEEIGRMIEVHFSLNAILNNKKQLVQVVAGTPSAVMQVGIPLSLSMSRVPVESAFDLAVASAGGHPKDRNLYQSQKALSHARPVVRDGGTVILVAACVDGSGNQAYESWMRDMVSHEDVLKQFQEEGFKLGVHKAFQIARDASRIKVILVSEMEPAFVRDLLLTASNDIQQALDHALAQLPEHSRVGILPNAPSIIPVLEPA